MEEWIKNLILKFREEYQKLTELEKSKIGNLDNLVPTLQIEAIIIRNQPLRIQNQLLIFTHFNDEPDLGIKVHEIDSNGVLEKLQAILRDVKWQKKMPEDNSWHIKDESKKVFATAIEGFLLQTLKEFKKSITNSVFFESRQEQSAIGTKIFLTKDSFVWQAFGDITKMDAKEIAGKIIENARNSAKAQPQPVPVPQPPRIKGFGTYFYPEICIGKRPEPSFKDRVIEPEFPLSPKKSFDAEYKGHKVVVNQNGFIAIGIDDRNKALRMLNEIMATALLFNLPFYAIRDSELGEAEIEPATLQVGGRSISVYVSLRTALFEDEIMLRPSFGGIFISKGIREIEQEQLIEIIKQADILARDETASGFLIYLLESFTYFQGSEYNQAFIMEWMIIERYINFLWMNKLNQMNVQGDRKDKLENYTADHIIEVLNLCRVINDEYSFLMEMKNKRNKFIHDGKNISKEDAYKGFQAVLSIVKRFCVNLGLLTE